jgi:hypothetical protein
MKRRSFLKVLFSSVIVAAIPNAVKFEELKRANKGAVEYSGKLTIDSGCFYCPYFPLIKK